MKLAHPHLPAHHPQNVPLSKWPDGWLTLAVCEHTSPYYMVMHDYEKRRSGWPVTREEKIKLLIEKGDVPAAGVD